MAINKNLLPIKIHYFLIFGALSGVLPLIPVYALQLGISSVALGYIFAVLSCLTTITRPMLGSVADYTQKLKWVLFSLMIVQMIAVLGLNFIPSHQSEPGNTTDVALCQRIDFSDVCGASASLQENKFNLSCVPCGDNSNCDPNETNTILTVRKCNSICPFCTFNSSCDRWNGTLHISDAYRANSTLLVNKCKKSCIWNKSFRECLNGTLHKSASFGACKLSLMQQESIFNLSCPICEYNSDNEAWIEHSNLYLNETCMCMIVQAIGFKVSCALDERDSLIETYHNSDSFSLEKLILHESFDDKCCNITSGITQSMKYDPPLQVSLFAVFVSLIYLCVGPITSLSDSACFNKLETRPMLYGKQRLWGAVGWGTFSLISGFLNQFFTGSSTHYSFSAGFYTLIVLLAIDFAILQKIELTAVAKSRSIFKDIGLLLVKPKIFVFLLQSFLVGVFTGFTRSYLMWYLRTMQATQLNLGLVSVVQCFLGELPFFFISSWIINKAGHMYTFTLSFVSYGVKFLAYYFVRNPWLGLPLEILQGPCFGSFYAAMTSYAKLLAPEGTESTIQGLATGVFEGLGLGTGSLLGGYGFQTIGERTTMLCISILSLLSGLFSISVNYVLSRNNN